MGKMPLGLPLGNKHQRLKTIIPPMPEVWLAYYKPSSGVQGGELPTVVVQLPQKAKKILWDQWRVAWPKYSKYYRAAPVKRNRDALVDLMVELSSASDWAIQKLVRVNINAPDGRRPITQNEAMDLVRLVNTFARDSVAPEKDKMTAQARWSAFEQRHLTTH